MAQVNVDPIFDISNSNIFTVESFINLHEFSENLSDEAFNCNYRIADATLSETFRIEISNLYDNYGSEIFSCDYEVPSFDADIEFNYLNINLRVRSGQCADVSLIQEYLFRAYNTNLNQYVFWTAGIKDFSESITGYDPAYLQNITILMIN